MNARSRNLAEGGHQGPALHDDTVQASQPAPAGPACCCPARPLVRVVMPATAARPHRTELLLCGHHYRVSRQALAAARAVVTEIPGMPWIPPAALLPGLRDTRACIS